MPHGMGQMMRRSHKNSALRNHRYDHMVPFTSPHRQTCRAPVSLTEFPPNNFWPRGRPTGIPQTDALGFPIIRPQHIRIPPGVDPRLLRHLEYCDEIACQDHLAQLHGHRPRLCPRCHNPHAHYMEDFEDGFPPGFGDESDEVATLSDMGGIDYMYAPLPGHAGHFGHHPHH